MAFTDAQLRTIEVVLEVLDNEPLQEADWTAIATALNTNRTFAQIKDSGTDLRRRARRILALAIARRGPFADA